ncbi:MAG: hypothetical protein IVW36_05275 [Dehalococcoidia bacterium]|nr:hypothetical protein [Dehalococcoidia bacterium]
MLTRLRSLKWNIIAPVALISLALVAVLGFDLAYSGEAEPPPLVGALGTPIRGTLVPPTATPVGAGPTVAPRPTVPGSVAGTPATRDGVRRNSLLIALDGFQKLKQRDGKFPSTTGNIQTLCAFKDLDVGCKLKDVIPGGAPADPLGNPVEDGYWYQSDGNYVKLYAALEEDIPADQKCPTDNVDLKKKPNLICILGR